MSGPKETIQKAIAPKAWRVAATKEDTIGFMGERRISIDAAERIVAALREAGWKLVQVERKL